MSCSPHGSLVPSAPPPQSASRWCPPVRPSRRQGADPPWSSHGLTATSILSGTSLQHTYRVSGTETTATETLSNPDDITQLDGVIFAGFQNGAGPQGHPSGDATPTAPSSR